MTTEPNWATENGQRRPRRQQPKRADHVINRVDELAKAQNASQEPQYVKRER